MARSYFKAKYWASKYFTVFVEEEEKKGFLPFGVGYGFIRDKPPHQEKRLTPEMIFGKDARKDPDVKRGPAAVEARPEEPYTPPTLDVTMRSHSERNADAMRTHRGNLFDHVNPAKHIEPFNEDAVKRILEQARRNAQVARDLELERQEAEMIMLMMMEM